MLKRKPIGFVNVKNREWATAIKESPYLQVNIIIAGIIILMMIYSGIFSYSGIPHPIKSNYAFPVISTGLSRAFSEIVRCNFKKAIEFNPYSIKLFSFFFIQLFLRVFCSISLLSNRFSKTGVLFTDILISVLLFLWTFYAFILAQF